MKRTSALKKGRNVLRRPGVPTEGRVVVVDRTRDNTNETGKIHVLTRTNLSPIPMRKDATFHFDSFFKMSCPQFQNSTTNYWAIMSLLDPDFSNVGSNKSVPYYDLLLGNTPGLYQFYRVKYVDVRVRVINTTANTFPLVTIRPTAVGSADFPSTMYIHNIAGSPMAASRHLEYTGDSGWQEFVYRIHPWEVLGIPKRVYDEDTHWYFGYGTGASQNPWLAISMGDGMAATGSGDAMTVNGQISIDYHVTLSDPVVRTAV